MNAAGRQFRDGNLLAVMLEGYVPLAAGHFIYPSV